MFKLFIVENVFSNDRRVLSNIAWRLNMMEIKANTWSLGLWKKIKMKNKKKNGIWSWKLNRVPAGTLSPLSNWLQLIGEVPWYNEYTMARASETESGQKFWNFHLSALFIFFFSVLFYFIFPLPSISSFFQSITFLFIFYSTSSSFSLSLAPSDSKVEVVLVEELNRRTVTKNIEKETRKKFATLLWVYFVGK